MAATHVPETRTTIDNILKYDYAPAIITATNTKDKLLTLMETKTAKLGWGGKSFIIPLEWDNMGSVGARAEDADLPNALPGSWSNAVVPIYYLYFSLAVTGPAMSTSDQDIYAWAEAWQREIVIKQRAWRQHINRIVNGDGNAILAQVDGTPSLSVADYTITLDNAYGLSGFNSSNVNGHRFTSTNMQVDFYTSTSLRDAGAVKITGYTRGAFPSTSATIVCASGDCDEVADGDYMYLAGSYGNEPPGLRLMIDDGTVATTFESLSTTTYPEWKSVVSYGQTPGTAEALTTNRIQSHLDDIETYNGGKTDWMYTSPAVWLTLGEMMRSEGQQVNAKTLDTGWQVIEFNGLPIFKDPYCIDHLYTIDNRCPKIHESKPQGWLDLNGSAINMDGDKDRWKAYWAWYFTPAMHNRAWCGKIVDISVAANKY